MKFTFIDLFAGIGGFRIALEGLGGKCIGYSEIEKNAIEVYKLNWPKDGNDHELGDITQLTSLPEHDVLVGGVPCQSWSIAGKNKGIEDSRGALWNDVIRLVDKTSPKAFVFENVKGLNDPRHREALNYLLDAFADCGPGYRVYHKILNSFDFGVPQNRDRIFIVGIRSKCLKKDFEWPRHTDEYNYLDEVFDGMKGRLRKKHAPKFNRDMFGERVGTGFNKLTPLGENNRFFILTDIRNGPTSIHSWDYKDVTAREILICDTMMKNRRKKIYGPCDGNPMAFKDIKNLIDGLKESELKALVKKKILRQYEDDGRYEFTNRRLSGGIDGVYRIFMRDSVFFPTLVASGSSDHIATKTVKAKSPEACKKKFIKEILAPGKYRKPKPHELKRLQGFPENFIIHPKDGTNVKLFGNSVAVPVIENIGKSLLNSIG